MKEKSNKMRRRIQPKRSCKKEIKIVKQIKNWDFKLEDGCYVLIERLPENLSKESVYKVPLDFQVKSEDNDVNRFLLDISLLMLFLCLILIVIFNIDLFSLNFS